MGKNDSKKKEGGSEMVRLKTDFVNRVRDHKKKTDIPIGAFIERAGNKELDRIKAKEV